MTQLRENQICKDMKAIYTFTGKKYCDGWHGVSIEECKKKCENNEIPNTQCPRRTARCAYALYTHASQWCHLADESCYDTGSQWRRGTSIYKKTIGM